MENVYSAIIETKKIFEDAPNIGWRLHEQVIRAYEVFPLLFDPELIFDHCVQSFFKMLSNVTLFLTFNNTHFNFSLTIAIPKYHQEGSHQSARDIFETAKKE